jgi:hypothetical protein
VLAAVYVTWAGLFIYQSSYVGIDGQRYFGLFDDAMVSMRYAWNFAHGLGLVWNAGQRVEGYSNLLMTLGMSLAAFAFDKKLAVLAVQIAGVPTMLITAYIAWRLSADVFEGRPQRAWIGLAACACTLFYYPLSYWTLMGMETGLLTLIALACAWFGLRWLRHNRTGDLIGMSFCASLAFLTRNDSITLTALTFGYAGLMAFGRTPDKRRFVSLIYAALFVALVVVGQTAFRYAYYGQLLPNTYTLKLTGIPLYIRLIGGTRFVIEFLQQTWLVLALALLGLALEFQPTGAFLFGFTIVTIAYQIFVGGDPWESWRMLAPAMPAAFILAAAGASSLVSRWPRLTVRNYAVVAASSGLVLASLILTDLPFLFDMAVRGPTSAAIANRVNTNTAIAIDALTSPGASVGVIWAGTLPYYADRYGVDFLGKSDAHIARLNADITGAVSWGGMISVPGHNKYDLEYSIVKLRPTYTQGYSWGYQTVKPWVVANYVRVEYQGALGTKTLFLLKDSPLVCWEACKGEYRIIPWPTQK